MACLIGCILELSSEDVTVCCCLPVVFVAKDEEALGLGGCQGSEALVGGVVAVPDLLQDHAHDNHIIHCLML